MLLVGLTGGIGSGKSTVSAQLAELGAVVIDADQIARDLQAPNAPLLAVMAERFGDHIIRDDGSLDRAAVAAIVFGTSDAARTALHDLNAIVHPAMYAQIDREIDRHRGTPTVVVLDFPLLLDSDHYVPDSIVVVDIDPELAVRRLVEHRGMDEHDARNRIASQISRERRLARADFVVDNSGDRDQLGRQVAGVWEALTAERDRSDASTT